MRRGQLIAVLALAAVTFGSLLVTGGYAWYLRSDAYRAACTQMLTHALELPASIGAVVPRSTTTREFRDVRVWLPERRGEAAVCHQALLTLTPTADDPEAYELDLRGGQSEISTRTWLREDYRFVLESGLRPGFAPDGPRRVAFSGMDLTFERGPFRASFDDASGVLLFDDPHLGRARLACSQFNEYAASQPVILIAAFSPQLTGIRLDHVELVVPEIPIAVVRLGELLGVPLKTGTFSGRLVHREHDDHEETAIDGRLRNVSLAECTAGFANPPWHGNVPELELQALILVNRRFQRLAFRGLLEAAVLGDILAPLGLGQVGGELALRVQAAELSPAAVDRLIAAGHCYDLHLDDLSAALGWGRVTGVAQVRIDDLTIIDNHLVSLDAEVVTRPTSAPPTAAGYIERALLLEVLRRTSGLTIPEPLLKLLPERVTYAQLGVRLEVRDELLTIFGTHGPREKTILSIDAAGQELPVLTEPEQSFDLRPYFDALRARLQADLIERLRTLAPPPSWWLPVPTDQPERE